MKHISLYMITKNEEKRIEKTLSAAIQVVDEIIIVDSGSTDKTIEIGKRYGAKIYHRDWTSYADQKHFAQNKCQYDWLLSLDADEVLSPELIQEIKKLKETEPHFKAYNLRIASMYPRMKYHRWTHTYCIIRLYNKRYATIKPDLLTEDRISTFKSIPIGVLKEPVFHYSVLNISQHVHKINQYTNDIQQTITKHKKTYSILRLIFEIPFQFIRYYLLRRLFIHGIWGFISAVNISYSHFLKIAKTIEREKL